MEGKSKVIYEIKQNLYVKGKRRKVYMYVGKGNKWSKEEGRNGR